MAAACGRLVRAVVLLLGTARHCGAVWEHMDRQGKGSGNTRKGSGWQWEHQERHWWAVKTQAAEVDGPPKTPSDFTGCTELSQE